MFHKKYIPESLDDIYGNRIIISRLKLLVTDKLLGGAAISLEGERGTGKSSVANILAKEFVDNENNIKIMNCRGIDELRDKLEEFPKSSIFGRKKVLILDELHRASKRAQEELLDTLDRYQSNDMLVISCTTEPDNLIGTVKDRFMRFTLMNLGTRDSFILIGDILKKEGIELSSEIKELLIKKSLGNPRRLLVGLYQLIGVEDIDEANYILTIGSLEDDVDVLKLFKLIINDVDWRTIVPLLNKLLETKTPEDVRLGLLNIAAGMITSEYYNEKSDKTVLNLKKSLYKIDNSIPSKSFLKLGLLEVIRK